MINSKELIAYQKRIEFLENELAEAKSKILDLEQQLIYSIDATSKTSLSHNDNFSQYDVSDTAEESPVVEVMTADMLAEIAESSIAQSSYVYDPDMKMYYDNCSKCYYDAERSLYYEPNSGVYYSYNEAKQSYEFHSQISAQDFNTFSHILRNKNSQNMPEHVKPKKTQKRQPKCQGNSNNKNNINNIEDNNYQTSEVEDGEILSDNDDDDNGGDDNDVEISSCKEAVTYPIELRNMPETYMSCIRCVIKSSNCIEENSLFIITCEGASIGRDKSLNHDIVVSDPTVSRLHCRIRYDKDQKEYSIVDEGSVSGTFVNDKRIGESKEISEAHLLRHMDRLRLGDSTIMEMHIHPCEDTCPGCQPWNFKKFPQDDGAAGAVAKMTTDQQRRYQLNMIKKKYGLKNMNYERHPMITKLSAKYQDRSKKRRLKAGRDNQPQICEQPASVNRALPESNVGHKMLMKMGWKSGQSLGKSQMGILEPIKAEIRVDEKAGIGSSNRIDLDGVGRISRLKTLMITKQRYENASAVDRVTEDLQTYDA